MLLHSVRDIEHYLLALVSASLASMKQAAGVLATLDHSSAAPAQLPDGASAREEGERWGPPSSTALAKRAAEAMISYQRGYQAALLDVARAAGCQNSVPRPGEAPGVSGGKGRGEISLAEFLEQEYLALGVRVGPGLDL